jgi:outer membrane lipoprotein-sorting protein
MKPRLSKKEPILMRLLLLTASALFLFTSAASAADPLLPVLSKMDAASTTFKGLTADMRKLHHTAIINEDEVDTGSLVVRRPKSKDLQVMFDIKQPNPQQFAFSGRKAEKYNPKTNTVEVYDVDKKYGSLINRYMLLGFGASPAELRQAYKIAYGGPENVGDKKTTRIELTPLQTDTGLHLVKAELWISDETGVALQQKLSYSGGDYDFATYSNMKVRDDIPESAVKLNLPKNAKREYPLK